MAELKCPKCDAVLSLEEIRRKCKDSIHLYKLTTSHTKESPVSVVTQCPNGDLVEVECTEASND
jgi:hypothetical protein